MNKLERATVSIDLIQSNNLKERATALCTTPNMIIRSLIHIYLEGLTTDNDIRHLCEYRERNKAIK